MEKTAYNFYSQDKNSNHSLLDITAIILTFNEEIHIDRCLKNVCQFCKSVIIIDSFSSDNTVTIAKENGAKVFQNPWTNYANQFSWALENCSIDSEWILRIDADEYFTNDLIIELKNKLNSFPQEITGLILRRRVIFLGKWLKYGGSYPIKLLRIWRNKKAKIEQRWMDEHIELTEGKSIILEHDFIDENNNGITKWIEKHNSYSNRELADLIIKKFEIGSIESINESLLTTQAERKKWLKQKIFNKTPIFFRSILYFVYRYFFLCGFLDGKPGFVWHILQGFWYRILIDVKFYEMMKICGKDESLIRKYMFDKFRIKI